MSVNTIHIEQSTVFSRDAETQLFAPLAGGATLGAGPGVGALFVLRPPKGRHCRAMFVKTCPNVFRLWLFFVIKQQQTQDTKNFCNPMLFL